MSAANLSPYTQPHFYFKQQRTVDLTQQEQQALNQMWQSEEEQALAVKAKETDTAHCAVLGYN
ncbi:hypothetical protein [Arsukibacterium sp.]|uniref:hypothetical protein n=1 Tax=Arsukibacterium sp. TaxID=1977258 RepID=UPI002FDB6C0F